MSKSVYIILSKTESFIGKSIRIFSRYGFNHASISLDKNLEEMYSFGRLTIANPMVGGMVKESPTRLSLGKKTDVYVKIFELQIEENQYLKLKRHVDSMINDFEGYFYNPLGIFSVMINRRIKPHKTYICSEFVIDALNHADIHVTDREAFLISPEDIEGIFRNQLIYEGSLFDYEFSEYSFEEKEFFERIGCCNEFIRTIKFYEMLITRHRKRIQET